MAHGEIFVQLSVNMADDPKVRALARYGRGARPARDLFVQMICYCKDNLTDGFVPAEQIGILVYPDSPAAGKKDAQHLVEVGLIQPVDGGWHLPGFLKRNRSKDAVKERSEAKRKTGSKANHVRWHAERGITKPDCTWCQDGSDSDPKTDSDRSPDRSPNGIHIGHRSEDIGQSHRSDTSEESATPPPPGLRQPDPTRPAAPEPGDEGEGEDKPTQDDPLTALIADVKAIRPEWSERSIHRALTRPSVAERPPEIVRHAALAVANDPSTQAPGRLEHDGPWWRLPAPPPKPPAPPPPAPWMNTPDLGARDNGEVNSRGRAAVEAAIAAAKARKQPTEPEGSEP